MSDQLLILEAPEKGLRLVVCTTRRLAQDAARRHQLADGSAAVLGQALTGALLLAVTDRAEPDVAEQARVDIQLDVEGPLKGLLVDADGNGSVRGLVRVNGLDRDGKRAHELDGEAKSAQVFAHAGHVVGSGAIAGTGAGELQFQPPQPLSRFDPRPLLGAASDRRAGALSVLRAVQGEQGLHRAHVPFSGADLGAGLSAFLRAERKLAGAIALEALFQPREPLAAVAGAMLIPTEEDQRDTVSLMGDVLRDGEFLGALLEVEAATPGNAHALAHRLAERMGLGELQTKGEMRPRFSCRCSRTRVVRALETLGPAELRDMAAKDGGAEATCDFCAEVYRIGAAELLALAEEPEKRQ